MNSKYNYNNQCLTKDGKPWFPVMGEMHYSRYRDDMWEESLRKMKAGGVTIVSTYVIWIHHEEEENCFDFSGCRNIKKFVELCEKVGLLVFLRLGPWVHGEVRNGGFPDWLEDRGQAGINLRTNDEQYLAYVKRFWDAIYSQVKDSLYTKGGPVIGIQIENEYGHVGGLRGAAGEEHMRTLTALARESGFEAPLYTATGWGGACIGDLLPVMGGYCEAPWAQSSEELAPSTNYVFSHVWNDAMIACDHRMGEDMTFDKTKFPYLTAELGGGLQVTRRRRPVAHGRDIGAMSLTKLGSGVALLGYYMYHGGSNPDGKFTTLQESKATGYANDLPEINYDFNAPIRQYGTISNTYKEIKLLAYFLQEFGEDLAALPAEIIPPSVKPDDYSTLRYSCRHDASHGYVFFNNYQRRRTMDAHKQVQFTGILGECGQQETDIAFISARPLGDGVETGIVFPPVDIEDGDFGFFPYNMKLGSYQLISALATPLFSIKSEENGQEDSTYVFYGDAKPQFTWKDDKAPDVIHLCRADALNAWKVKTDREYLIISDNFVWEEDGKLRVVGTDTAEFKSFPELTELPNGFEKAGTDGRFTQYKRKLTHSAGCAEVEVEEQPLVYSQSDDSGHDKSGSREYLVTIHYNESYVFDTNKDIILNITYNGESMDAYLGDKKINDYFYTGQTALLSLRYYDFPAQLKLIVHPLEENAPIFLETLPEFKDGTACEIVAIEAVENY